MKINTVDYVFPCTVYSTDLSDYHDTIEEVSNEYLKKYSEQYTPSLEYPLLMSDNFSRDYRVKQFSELLIELATNVLIDQGYAMDYYYVDLPEMWTQQHHKYSSMERHVHGLGAHLTGFYFLKVPDNTNRILFHDPRSSKVQSQLPEADSDTLSASSTIVNYTASPGKLILTNSWLPHSFTKNFSDQPFEFVHLIFTAHNKYFNTSHNVEVV